MRVGHKELFVANLARLNPVCARISRISMNARQVNVREKAESTDTDAFLATLKRTTFTRLVLFEAPEDTCDQGQKNRGINNEI